MAALTKDEVMAELAGALARQDGSVGEDKILEALIEREKLGPFSMGKGVAFLHARLDSVENFRVAMGTSPAGIDFKAPDGQMCRVVLLFIIPKKHANLYLTAFAEFLNFFSSEERVAKVAAAAQPPDILQYLKHG